MLLFPCRFIRYRADLSPLDGHLTDAYQDPYVPENDGLADCEDFSKVIQLSYFHLLDAAAFKPAAVPALLLPALAWLLKYEVVILQGAANVSGTLKNHVWAGLVGKEMLRYMVSGVDSAPPTNAAPTSLLEGTYLALGSGNDMWQPRGDVERFYAYTMAMHVAPRSELGGDYELVRYGEQPVYAMPSAQFFQSDWGLWRALRVDNTTLRQDKAAEAWMRAIEIPRRFPRSAAVLKSSDVPARTAARPSRERGISIDLEWKLFFQV
jgi:hypothetical protein